MKKIILLAFLIITSAFLNAQVAINTDGSSADPSAMLDIKSDTAGILIPRMTAAQRDAINNPAQGLLVFVSDDSTFCYYKNSTWIPLGIEDADFFSEGTSNPPSDINDDMYTMGNVAIGRNTADYPLEIETTETHGLYLRIGNYSTYTHSAINTYFYGTGSGTNTGVNNAVFGNGILEGVSNYIYGGENNDSYLRGIFTSIHGSGNGTHSGVSNLIYTEGSGKHYGIYSRITGGGSGEHYGAYNLISGVGTGKQYGVYNRIDNSGNADHYGTYNSFSDGSGNNYGTYNHFYGNGTQYGLYNFCNNSGSGDKEGVHNWFDGNGDGDQTGLRTLILNSGNGDHFGVHVSLSGSGTGKKYGILGYVDPLAGGTHYAVYGSALKTGSFAAYFLGNVAIGTTDVNKYILPANDGSTGQIMQTDGAGQVSFVDPSSIDISLDQAYDGGGSGAGKDITADAGTVKIEGTDGLLVTGSLNSGASIDDEITGWGTRMFFYPKKAAFRAGNVNSSQWDDTNIGQMSIAFGNSTKASASSSTAMGSYAEATANYATSIGINTVASGDESMALGSLTTASGDNSTSLGYSTTASGKNATASGVGTEAFSYRETVVGSYNTDYSPLGTISWHSADRLFVVANGTDDNNKSDALIVYKSGNTQLHEKLTAPTSGNADLKPYIYGSIKDTDGTAYISESTTGFTSVKESTGVYKISFSSYSSDKDYLVFATALRVTAPIILTYEKNYGYFRIRAWDLSGSLVDAYFNFMVIKK